MWYVYQAAIGKVVWIISDSHAAFKNFGKGKREIYKGDLQQCEDFIGNTLPEAKPFKMK